VTALPIAPAPPDAGADRAAPAVRLAGAQVRRGARTVWHDVTLEVGHGELVVVLGATGSGKTTLLRALLGFVPLADGHAEVLGTAPGRAPGVGYVAQRRAVGSSLRVRPVDLVRLGLDGHRWGLPPLWGARRRERERRVREALALTGADALADRPFAELSGGEQQRVHISQALVRSPRLLLLDEPLTGLDPAAQAAVVALLARVRRVHGVTVVVVSHDVNPFLGEVDSVAYLANGRAATGRPEEVVCGPVLSRLYGGPVEVLRTVDGRLVVTGAGER
jgi:zinc/manganese transport system ATP-binding protein